MNAVQRPVNSHKAYHAHIYFDENSKTLAKQLCDLSAKTFGLSVGRFHEKLVGPHPCWSCQVTLSHKDFDCYISWLDANREQLTVFIHPITGDAIQEHTTYAYWLGPAVPLNLDVFGVK